jgi:lysophospholipase L1-like esterase
VFWFLTLVVCSLVASEPRAAALAPESRVTTANPLPRVLLIGDSITLGYAPTVAKLLKSRADVHVIPENARATSHGVERLEAWLGAERWDVIHFNWGLHDLARTRGAGRQVPLARYIANLRVLTARLAATGARLIWADTTPVPAPGSVDPRRSAADVARYNRAAREVMHAAKIRVNPLYDVAIGRLRELQIERNVHFRPEGYALLGRAVAEAIEAELVTLAR